MQSLWKAQQKCKDQSKHFWRIISGLASGLHGKCSICLVNRWHKLEWSGWGIIHFRFSFILDLSIISAQSDFSPCWSLWGTLTHAIKGYKPFFATKSSMTTLPLGHAASLTPLWIQKDSYAPKFLMWIDLYMPAQKHKLSDIYGFEKTTLKNKSFQKDGKVAATIEKCKWARWDIPHFCKFLLLQQFPKPYIPQFWSLYPIAVSPFGGLGRLQQEKKHSSCLMEHLKSISLLHQSWAMNGSCPASFFPLWLAQMVARKGSRHSF